VSVLLVKVQSAIDLVALCHFVTSASRAARFLRLDPALHSAPVP
jgi:hypothetical protein